MARSPARPNTLPIRSSPDRRARIWSSEWTDIGASAADHLGRLARQLSQFSTRGAGAGADGDGVHRGGRKHGQCCWIGIGSELALLARSAETRLEITVEGLESRREALSDFSILEGFGYR